MPDSVHALLSSGQRNDVICISVETYFRTEQKKKARDVGQQSRGGQRSIGNPSSVLRRQASR